VSIWGELYRRTEIRDVETTINEANAVAEALRDAQGEVLDVGCGDGLHMARLRLAGMQVRGVDFDKTIAPGVCDFGDLRCLPYPAGYFAGAYSLRNTAFGFDDRDLGFVWEEMARVLKPGAPLFVTCTSLAWAKHHYPEPELTVIGDIEEMAWMTGDRLEMTRSIDKLRGSLSVRLFDPVEFGTTFAPKYGLEVTEWDVVDWENRITLRRTLTKPTHTESLSP
jgi:SAM-dependent methyltransferase